MHIFSSAFHVDSSDIEKAVTEILSLLEMGTKAIYFPD